MRRIFLFGFFITLMFTGNGVLAQKSPDMAGHSTRVVLSGSTTAKKAVLEKNTKIFLDAVNKAYVNNTQPILPSGIADSSLDEVIGNMWAVSLFFSVNPDIIETVSQSTSGNFEVRNIQIVFDEADGVYKQQDAVLIFDPQGKIVDFKIAIGLHSINNILRNNVSVTDLRRRQMIISFVENFRTAYNIKDLVFLDNVFSDKALIITGKVITKLQDGEMIPIVEYKRQTKVEYLSNLKEVFHKTKMINIIFDSVSVVQHPSHPDIYGVTLTQSWNSETLTGGKYKDVGYIFLIIDFTVESNPKIWVRTWQDKEYVERNHGVFSFNHFNIK